MSDLQADLLIGGELARKVEDPSSTPSSAQQANENCKMQGLWDFSEERYFYEYLRVAPSHNKEQCCFHIAAALDSRDIQTVAHYYESAIENMKHALDGCSIDWNNCPPSRLHKALVYHWDKTLVCRCWPFSLSNVT